MAAIIEIMGHTVSFDGIHWASENPAAAELCELRAKDFVARYYPDIVSGLATAVAKSLNGRVIHLDPKPQREGPPPEHMAY
ncbi:hypothetical protein CfE428DRAFT_4213 [Chthoniobacter flavus Ellin428]|uniref:Uncharacterized protein n=1 Tax=Chthoniobacter flavus Ellin428 TaxID=497964 RepID=B4D5M4_9BACT|nr:hypothetical protein [Chthoniobacter flavus]EDY18429.1 hypothetical protein CfE428DRAFT_4213 [Chthoniobacter flavus Ellin428]TCO90862.1 hypothetical protein EV701_10911 [Chthoniobacter flavus]